MTHIFCHRLIKNTGTLLLASILLFCCASVFGQTTTVLPNNSTYSSNNSPQGALRYQRGFYLVTPAEMNSSGFTTGISINSIGFTLGRAQGDTTQGRFRLYLQNTNDIVSRYDTNWTTVTSATNSYAATGLLPGSYEWQVQANCSSISAFTSSVNFSNNNLRGCNNPYNLETKNIGSTTASLSWESSSSPAFTSYLIEYTPIDLINWTAVTTTDTTYNLAGLTPGKLYQWRVTTICGTNNSPVNYTSFSTGTVSGCASLTGLLASVSLNTTVAFSWTANNTANYYEYQFRRVGTIDWSGGIAFTNSATVTLPAGTSYEWQVRIVCGAGATGGFASSTVTTGGTTVCYTPVQPVTRQITNNSALLSWKAVQSATYTIRYRLKRSISWANATNGMTLTNDSIISVPDTTGAYNIPFHGGSAFTYTGSGVYVAWEYTRPNGALTSPNLTLSTTNGTNVTGANGQDTTGNLLSMVSMSDSSLASLPSILSETRLRPETRFGSPGLKDSVKIIAVYTLGFTSPKFQTPTPVKALVTNLSASAKSYNVTLTVKEKQTGTVRYTNTQALSVNAADTVTVSFTGWIPSVLEMDSVIVSIPAQLNENVTNNNSKAYLQNVNASLLAYDDGSPLVSQAGFGTGTGLLLNKHNLQGCGKVIAAKIFLTESAKGNPVYAVVRNSAGSIISQSASFTPSQTDINQYHSFSFISPASFLNEDFYIGLAQQTSAIAYYPVGTQWEDEQTRKGAYYHSNLDGTNLVDYPQDGRLMIIAEIVSSAPDVTITGNLTLCTGGSTVLTAGSRDTRYANSVISYSSQYAQNDYSAAQALGSPNVFPAYELSPKSWTSATTQGQREYLELGFANPGKINFVDIFETSNPGAVDSIFAKNPATSAYVLLYSATASAAPLSARKNHITFTETTFDVSAIRIAINSPAVPGYNAIDAVGIGKETSPGTFATLLWSPGGETTATKTVTTAGTYSVAVSNSSGCLSSASVTVVAAPTTAPVITASGPLSFCPGGSVILTSNLTSNITWSNGATTPSITVNSAGSYTVTYNGGSCGALTSAAVSVTINALPAPAITGSLELCLGSQTILNAGAGFSNYLWSTGQTSQTISVTTAGIYSVTVTNTSGCKGSASVTVAYVTLAAPVIAGTLGFCPGGSTTLNAGNGYSSYLWSNGATTQSITVTTPATYSVTVKNAGGCSASASVTTNLFATPVPSISGTAGFCAGGSTTLTAGSGYSSYLWSTGASSQSVVINASGTKSVTVVDQNGCTGSASLAIQVFPNPAPVISGTLSFCGGTSTTLNAGSGYNSYLWSTGSTSQTIVVNSVGTYSVTVINSNGCSSSASVTTTQTGAIPVSPGVISGPAVAGCGSTGNTYSIAAVANTSHYVWMMPAGATIASGQGSTTISVNFASGFAGGYIEVAASNACGQSPSITARKLYVQSTANRPGPIGGQITGLCGPVTKAYSIAAVPLATSYTWSAPQGTTILSGQGTTAISLSVAAGFTSGNLCVTANNGCGSSPSSCVTLAGNVARPGIITGVTDVCSSADNMLYSIADVPGASSYTWTVPQASSITSGQGTTSILIRYGTKSGDITVKANSSCGSSDVQSLAIVVNRCNGNQGAPTPVNVTQLRLVPEVISAYGGTATAGQIIVDWTMGEMMVENITKADMLYTQGFHQPFILTPVKQTSVLVAENIQISVYPNPVRSYVNISFETSKDRLVDLNLFDANGKLLQSRQVNTKTKIATMQMLGYSAGSYYIVVRDQSGKILQSITVIKGAQ